MKISLWIKSQHKLWRNVSTSQIQMYSTVLTFIHQYKNYSQHLGQRSKVLSFKGEQRQNYSLEIIIPLLLSLLLTPQWWLRGCGRLFAKMTTNLSSLDMGPLAVWHCHSSHEEVGSNSPTLESGLALRLALINGMWWKESCVTSKCLSEKTLQLLPLQKLRPPCCEDSRDTRTWRESPNYCNHPSHLVRSICLYFWEDVSAIDGQNYKTKLVWFGIKTAKVLIFKKLLFTGMSSNLKDAT